jgi:hypothetical protein
MANTEKTSPAEWVSELAEREKVRRADLQVYRDQLQTCSVRLTKAINMSIERYFQYFPEERAGIRIFNDDQGYSVIMRSSVMNSVINPRPIEVRFRFSIERMLMECRYSNFAEQLSRDYPLSVLGDGSIGLNDGSPIEVLAERMLKPILFPHFIAEESQDKGGD